MREKITVATTPGRLLCGVGLILVLVGLSYGRPLPRYISVPKCEKPVMSTDANNDLFENYPAYDTSSKRLTVQRAGWEGEDDYTAVTRVCWTKDGLYFRFDIKDDKPQPSTNMSMRNLTGDYILLKLQHETAGPEPKNDPFYVLMLPNPAKRLCLAAIESDKVSRTRIGRPRTKLFKTGDNAYAVILQLPVKSWVEKPRKTRVMRAQIMFGDSDTKGKVDHVFAQFPRSEANWSFKDAVGTLHFVEHVWAKVTPAKAKYNSPKVTFLLDYGNLDLVKADLQLTFRDPKGEVVKVMEELYRLEPGTAKQGVKLKLDLSELPKDLKCRVEAKAGIDYDPATFHIQRDDSEEGVAYCPDLIEKRRKRTPRPLLAYRKAALIEETFRQMAGGGEVIWHVGRYDASSAEFPELIRKTGPTSITIPSQQDISKEIPWAIFGGADHLDKMNEPLIVNLDRDALKGLPRLAPDLPRYKYLSQQSKPRRTSQDARQLLLLGVLTQHMNPDQYAVVRIANQLGRVVLEQRLRPTEHQAGTNHAYVLRLWLDGNDKELRIDNPSPDGPRFEIDFMALLKGGPETGFQPKRPALRFTGAPEAEQFTKMLSTNLFFIENYLIDAGGRTYSSPPGGRYREFRLRDFGMLINELPNWGATDTVERLWRELAFIYSRITPRETKESSIGFPLLVSGAYNAWRKTGMERRKITRVWQPVIERRLQEIDESAEGNQQGLVSAGGELGTPPREGGASAPVALAARAAVNAGARLYEAIGYKQQKEKWLEVDKKLEAAFEKNLVAPPGGQKLHSAAIYPAAHGFPEVKGIQVAFPEDCWLFARNANNSPIGYSNGIRVFDTPYIFAGLHFWTDVMGFGISERQHKQLNRTRVFMLDRPIMSADVTRKYGIVTFKSCASQLWLTMAGLLLENQNVYTKSIDAFIRYNFDEYTPIPPGSDIELSPYTVEEKQNVSEKGRNLGGSLDECSAMTTVTALKVGRLIAGIDDSEYRNLKLMPRLPTTWKTISASDWLITHDTEDSNTTKIDYSYERFTGNRYSLKLKAESPLRQVTLRIGPFPGGIRRVSVNLNGRMSTVAPVRINGPKWVVVTEKKVRNLDISVRPVGF